MQGHEIQNKTKPATCSSVTQNAIDEVLKRPEVQNILKEDRISIETKFVETLLTEISKSGKSTYGLKETAIAAEAGAVQDLLISDSLIQESRLKGIYSKVERIMKNAEKSQGKVRIISSSHDAGKKLKGLGGVAAILRYQLNF